jgi:phosphate transport system substrate-binding protein
LLLRRPVGTPATGNEGVADAIAKKKNSIGYVEFVQAERAGLSHVATQNCAVRFVSPAPAAFAAAAANAEWKAANDFRVLLSDAPGEEPYPVAATVFILIVQRNPG